MSAVASALLFGTSATLNKIALENVHPTVVAGMIYFVGGVFLFGIHFSPLSKKILALFESPEIEPKITTKDFRILAARWCLCRPTMRPPRPPPIPCGPRQ